MPYIDCPTCRVSTYTAAVYSTTDICEVCGTPIGNGKQAAEVPGCRTLTRELVAAPDSIPAARRAVDDLREELGEALHATVELLVSELVTNSVRHSGCGDNLIELHILVTPEAVRLRVTDEGVGFGPASRSEEGAGWGLLMVEELTDRWGAEPRAGASVWFEIDRRAELDEEVADLARAATAASRTTPAPRNGNANGTVVPITRQAYR